MTTKDLKQMMDDAAIHTSKSRTWQVAMHPEYPCHVIVPNSGSIYLTADEAMELGQFLIAYAAVRKRYRGQ
jgi:hypothetical protein